MAAPNQPDILNMAWAANATSADVNEIADTKPTSEMSDDAAASWSQGFPPQTALSKGQGGYYVSRQDMNGVLQAISLFCLYIQSGGQFLWNSSLDYPVDAVVRGSDNRLYVSKAVNGPATGNATNPTTANNTVWSAIADLNSNQTFTGTNTFTKTIEGNAKTASKLAASKTISLSGGATGTATAFDGSQNITIPVTALNVGNANAGTLPIARGGTGMTSSPSLLVNVGSTSADTILKASPRPGVTGTLAVANGGTGVTTIANIKAGKDASGNTITATYLPFSGGTTTGLIVTSTANAGFSVQTSTYQVTLLRGSTYCGLWDGVNREWILRQDSDYNNLFFGNSSTASKLATARTIRTNLGSTSTASFDGSANVTPGVSGTLPVVNGGTGNAKGRGPLTLLSTRNKTNGEWTITGVTKSLPLFILHKGTSGGATCGVTVVSGVQNGNTASGNKVGEDGTSGEANQVLIFFPTATTVKLSVVNASDDDILYAYQ